VVDGVVCVIIAVNMTLIVLSLFVSRYGSRLFYKVN
jgi:hypothetical protein